MFVVAAAAAPGVIAVVVVDVVAVVVVAAVFCFLAFVLPLVLLGLMCSMFVVVQRLTGLHLERQPPVTLAPMTRLRPLIYDHQC